MMVGKMKEVLKPNAEEKEFVFSKFCCVETGQKDVLESAKSENCNCERGVLATGIGLKLYENEEGNAYPLPADFSDMQKVAYFWKDGALYGEKAVFLQGNNDFYIYDTATNSAEKVLNFTSEMQAIDFVGVDFQVKKILYGAGGVWTYDSVNGAVKILDEQACNACVCKDRLFLLMNSQQIVYSAPGNATDFSESTSDSGRFLWLPKRGKAVGMAVLEDSVYIFAESGVMCLHVTGSAKEFTFEEVSYTGGDILKGSVAVSDGKLCFLATDGVYLLDGKSVKKAYEDLAVTPRENSACRCVPFESGFILQYTDTLGVSRTAVLNKDGKSGYFIFNAVGLNGFEGKAFCENDGYIQTFSADGSLPANENYYFLSRHLDFGDVKAKTLRSLTIDGFGSLTLKVIGERTRETFLVDLSSGRSSLPVMMNGGRFQLEFFLNQGAVVKKVIADVERLKRR